MKLYSYNENEDENEKKLHRYDINRPRSRNGHKCQECLNIRWLYILSNT